MDGPPPAFDGLPPSFNPPHKRFDGPPPGFNQAQHCFDGPPRFNRPPPHFDGDKSQKRFDVPPRLEPPRPRFDVPSRFEPPQQRFEGPVRFDQPRPHFDGPARFDQSRPYFNGPSRFDQPRTHLDGPPRFDQPLQRFDTPPRFEPPPKHPGTLAYFERPAAPQEKHLQGPQPNEESNTSVTDVTKSPEQQLSKQEMTKAVKDTTSKTEDLTDDNVLGGEGFFLQEDPIPQTLSTKTSNGKNDAKVSENCKKSEPLDRDQSAVVSSSFKTKHTAGQISLNQTKPLASNNPLQVSKSTEIQQNLDTSSQMQPGQLKIPFGREQGKPPVPMQMREGVCGQMDYGEFRRPGSKAFDEKMGEMPYDYMPPEEEYDMPQKNEVQHEDFHWQDPSCEEYGREESEVPPEEIWMPEEDYFPAEDEYYDESAGPFTMGRGGPQMMRGGPPMGRGSSPMARGGVPFSRGNPPLARGPHMGRGGPHLGPGGPSMGAVGPPMGPRGPHMGPRGPVMGPRGPHMGPGGPHMGRGVPLMGRGGPHMGRGGQHMGRGGLQMLRGGPPIVRGGPLRGRGIPLPFGRSGPHPLERGDPMVRQWEESDSVEYTEGGEPAWEGMPPTRGMRPPFPPGRGHPPRGHPGFMQQGPARPPHLARGPIDPEFIGHDFDGEHAEQEFYGHVMHSEGGRGRRRVPPPPPHELIDPVNDQFYEEEFEGEQRWPNVRGRPHDIMDPGVRGRPTGRGMARGMFRAGPTHQMYNEEDNDGYVLDYGHGEDLPRWQPPKDHPPEDYQDQDKYYESERERGRLASERDDHRDGPRQDETPRGHPFNEHSRGKGELRIRVYRDESPYKQDESSYQQPPNFDRARIPSSDVGFSADYDDHASHYDKHRTELPRDRLPLSTAHGTKLPETPDSSAHGSSGPNVLALSQHQHEIILKAAQELKLIR